MSIPLVSVILVSYNHERFVIEAIKSVIYQSYGFENIELIVVDNGSRDSSQEVIRTLAEKHDFKFLINPDNGVAKAFSIAEKECAGKYIIPFSSDDLMTQTRIKDQVDFLEQNSDIAGVFGNMLCIDDSSNIHSQLLRKQVKESIYEFSDVFANEICLYSPTHMYRMDVYREVGGYDPLYKIEDLALYFSILSRGYKFATLNKLFAMYRIHGSSTHTNYKYMFKEKMHLYKAYSGIGELYSLGLKQVYLEHFSVFSSWHKLDAVKLLPKVLSSFNSKYFWIGALRLLFDWRIVFTLSARGKGTK